MITQLIFLAVAVQQPSKAEPRAAEMIETFRTCQKIKADPERLTCFDRATSALMTSVDRRDVILTDRQEVREAKRSLFGFTIGRNTLFDSDPQTRADEDAFTTVTTTLTSTSQLRGGLIRFVLQEGAVWETTEAVTFPPKTGSEVTIRSGSLGSYFAKFQGGRAVRAKRIK